MLIKINDNQRVLLSPYCPDIRAKHALKLNLHFTANLVSRKARKISFGMSKLRIRFQAVFAILRYYLF